MDAVLPTATERAPKSSDLNSTPKRTQNFEIGKGEVMEENEHEVF